MACLTSASAVSPRVQARRTTCSSGQSSVGPNWEVRRSSLSSRTIAVSLKPAGTKACARVEQEWSEMQKLVGW